MTADAAASVTTRWWWVRHAPIPDAEGRINGCRDVDCDTSDRESLAALARLLPADPTWVISPLARTRQTLDALARECGCLPASEIEPDFREQSFGHWEGLSWQEMQARDPDAYAAFWADPTGNAPPGGESFADLIARTRAGITRLTHRHGGRDIVAIAHGGTIRAAVAVALDLPPATAMAIVVDNLSLTRLAFIGAGILRSRGGTWMVLGVNAPCRWIR